MFQKFKLQLLIFILALASAANAQLCIDEKIDGVSLESPNKKFEANKFNFITNINANWIAVSPYGFSRKGKPSVYYNSNFQWWGEKIEGTKAIIKMAQEKKLKVMLKPQVWMQGTWVGDFELTNETDWKKWESDYKKFILDFAKVAAEFEVEIFCIGTEYRIAAVKRQAFFEQLIKEIKSIYNGKLVYAANWDNYQKVKFWDQLDYIGIDSYFPLVNTQTPEIEQLTKAWQPIKQEMKNFSAQYEKPILFCEYGYMSCDYSAWQNWENEQNRNTLNVNLKGQQNSFEAFFQTFWQEDWFAGGFIWKWYVQHETMNSYKMKDYTPQNKPVEKNLQNWFR